MTLSVRGRMVGEDAGAGLLAETRLVARVVEDSLATGTRPEALDPVVDEVARDVSARITIVAPDGTVLGDSALSGAALTSMENHAGRPEVGAALADREMSSRGTARASRPTSSTAPPPYTTRAASSEWRGFPAAATRSPARRAACGA